MGSIGVSRKVDPEEAIDTTARRERIRQINQDSYDKNKDDPESTGINNKARNSRFQSTMEELKKEVDSGRSFDVYRKR